MQPEDDTIGPPYFVNMPIELLEKIFRMSRDDFEITQPPSFHKVCRRWKALDSQIRTSSGTAISIPHEEFDQNSQDAVPNITVILHDALQRATETNSFLHIYFNPWRNNLKDKSPSTEDLAAMFHFPNFSHCVKTLVEQLDTGIVSRTASMGIGYPNLEEWQVRSIVAHRRREAAPFTFPNLQRLYLDKCESIFELNTIRCESLTVLIIGLLSLSGTGVDPIQVDTPTIDDFGRVLRRFPKLVQVGLGLTEHDSLNEVTVSTPSVLRLGLLNSDKSNSRKCWSKLLHLMPKVREITFGVTRHVYILDQRYHHRFRNIIHLTMNAVKYHRSYYSGDSNPLKQPLVVRHFLRAFPSLVTLEFKASGGTFTSYYVPGWPNSVDDDGMGWLLFMEGLRDKEPSQDFLCPLLRHIKLDGWNVRVSSLRDLLKTLAARGKDGSLPGSVLLTTKSCYLAGARVCPDVTEIDYRECERLHICST